MSVLVVRPDGAEGAPPACQPHLLPCEVAYTGAAPVSAYFRPTAVDDSDTLCHFRGRELRGRKLNLPPGYDGLVRAARVRPPPGTPDRACEVHVLRHGCLRALPQVVQDTLAASIADAEERRWVQRGTFSELTYWKHDEAPAPTDPLVKCIEWAELAAVLHAHHGPPPVDSCA